MSAIIKSVKEDMASNESVMGYSWRPEIMHHGALHGVTGSCHELFFAEDESVRKSVLIDCGLFQGDDHSSHGETSANAAQLMIDFDLSSVRALCVTHAHIDHIGRCKRRPKPAAICRIFKIA